jgi:thioredoxin 1
VSSETTGEPGKREIESGGMMGDQAAVGRQRLKTTDGIMNNNVIELNEMNFKREVLNARDPVLVEFWADWSDPCKAMVPMLESIAEDGDVPVKVAKVNVEHHEQLAEEYGVRAVPTLLVFSRGGLRDQIIGRTTEREVREMLENFV